MLSQGLVNVDARLLPYDEERRERGRLAFSSRCSAVPERNSSIAALLRFHGLT